MEYIHNEYYVAYNVIGISNRVGHFVCKPTKLRGQTLVNWLYKLAVEYENKQQEHARQNRVSIGSILITTINEVASWVVEER